MSLKKEFNRRSLVIKQEPGFTGRQSEFCLDKIIPDYTKDLVTSYKLLQRNGLPVKLVALVHKRPELLDLEKVIERINHPLENLSSVKDFFITNIESEEALVFLWEKPSPESLLLNHLDFFKGQDEIILQQLAIPLLELLTRLHNQELAHNNINFKTIALEFINNKISKINLIDSLLELPGYYQNPTFEERSRLAMHRAGKNFNQTSDAYALGYLILALFSGNLSLKGSLENIIHSKIHKGSYKTAIDYWFDGDDSTLPLAIKIVSFWLLEDNPTQRWTPAEALKFLRKRHKKITVTSWKKKTNSHEINQDHFSLELNAFHCKSRAEAANLAINNYDEIKVKVKNGKLIKSLLNNSNIKPPFINNISYLRSIAAKSNNNFLLKDDLFLTFFIIGLDGTMPLKLKDLAFHPLAFWSFFNYLSHKDSNQIYYNSLAFITSGLLPIINQGLNFLKLPIIELLEGTETFLARYSNQGKKAFLAAVIKPHRAFKSPLIKNKIVFTSSDLLQLINQLEDEEIAEALENEKILAWLEGKLWLAKGLITDNIINLIVGLEEENLVNIARVIVKKLPKEKLGHSLNLRSKNLVSLEKAAQEGKIKLIKRILEDKALMLDNKNFHKTQKRIQKIEAELLLCNQAINKKGLLFASGQSLAKKIVGLFFIITLIHLSYKLLWLI
jgi:serine/threonine protein kinase